MSKLDSIKEFVKANPDARWWVEEALVRGTISPESQGGIVVGAHVIFGVEFTDATGGRTKTYTESLPVDESPTGVPIVDAIGAVQFAQQATIDQHIASIADAESQMKALQETHAAELERVRADARAAVDAALAQVADLTAQRDALGTLPQAQEAMKAKRIAELEAVKVNADAELAKLAGGGSGADVAEVADVVEIK